jgi:hypothetical protein
MPHKLLCRIGHMIQQLQVILDVSMKDWETVWNLWHNLWLNLICGTNLRIWNKIIVTIQKLLSCCDRFSLVIRLW